MELKILTDITSYRKIIDEERKRWLYELLYFLGIDIKSLEGMDPGEATSCLVSNHIFVCDYPGLDAIKIEYRPEPHGPLELAGEWAGPDFTMKRDENGELYYEISIECWSIVDEGIDME